MRCTVALRWLISAKPFGGVAVDELVRAGRRFAQDAEPRERVLAEVAAGRRAGHGGAGDAARSVRADDELGLDLERCALGIRRDDARAVGLGALDALGGDTEAQVLPGGEARGDEVLEHLVLRVEPHAAPDELRRSRCGAPRRRSAARCRRAGCPTVRTRGDAPDASRISTVPCSRIPARIVVLDLFARALVDHDRLDAGVRRAGARAAARRALRR